jgi:hypothetical protein
MAILLERLPRFHVGYNCGRATDPAGTIRQLNLGWLAFVHFHGSLTDLLKRWQRTADDAVRERAEMWVNAETIGTDGEVQS